MQSASSWSTAAPTVRATVSRAHVANFERHVLGSTTHASFTAETTVSAYGRTSVPGSRLVRE
jgi:hypothetical protein